VPVGRYKPDVDYVKYVRNYSSRHGTRPCLIVIHSTQGQNLPGIKDLQGLGAWFDNAKANASSTVGVDNEGNSARYVRDANKAWTQSYYNPWSLSIENVGVANVTDWSDELYKENARWIAFWADRFKIRPYKAQVTSDGRILKPGVIRHSELGNLGGNHRDPGSEFDLARCTSLARVYLKRY
jgi:N-acetylmuramoyl-L-alanine amidase-like protein